MNALMVGSLLVNAAAVATMGVIAKRVGGLGAALVVLVAASAVARALGMELLVDPWVCWITVLPFGTFCLLTWAMADGRIWALPGDGGGRVVPRADPCGLRADRAAGARGRDGLAGGAGPRRSTPDRTAAAARRSRSCTAGRARRRVGAAAVGRMAGRPAISRPIVPLVPRHQGGGAHAHRGRSDRRRAVCDRPRLGHRHPTHRRSTGRSTLVHTTLVPLLLIPVVLAGVVAFRRRDRVAAQSPRHAGGHRVAAMVSVARTSGTMYEYRLLWTWTLGALVTAAAAFALWRWLRPRPAAAARPVLDRRTARDPARTHGRPDRRRARHRPSLYVWDSPEVAQAVAPGRDAPPARRRSARVLVGDASSATGTSRA